MNTPEITQYHAHVYFDETTVDQAVALCEQGTTRFDIRMGRVHRRPVGPHPCWSCQLSFPASLFGELVPWLSLHRDGLSVFVHPLSGNDLHDHSRYVIWLGDSKPINMGQFL